LDLGFGFWDWSFGNLQIRNQQSQIRNPQSAIVFALCGLPQDADFVPNMKIIEKISRLLESALKIVLCVLFFSLIATVLWQVFSRLISKISVAYDLPQIIQPSKWSEELAVFQLAWLALLGAAYAMRTYAHLSFESIEQAMSPRQKKITDYAARGAVILFCLTVMVYGGAKLVLMTLELNQMTPALQIPMAYVYVVIPLSGALMAFFAVEGVYRDESPEADEFLTNNAENNAEARTQ
jgi:TRAP-type C4-dicarboxylate transport system permease small subunit